MEAKDTVMKFEERKKFGVWNGRERLAEAQAEISFKAGYKEAFKSQLYNEGYQAGIREVVEWIEKNSHTKMLGDFPLSYNFDPLAWQAQKKEWGIEWT